MTVSAKRTNATKLVRRWAEATNDRDLTTLLNLAHPDIECQPLKLSAGGAYRGRTGLVEWILDLMGGSTGIRVRIEHVQALSTERVAVFGTAQVHEEDIAPYALLAVVRDGRVAVTCSYLSDEPTMERLGLLG
jgi:hypothetical protein